MSDPEAKHIVQALLLSPDQEAWTRQHTVDDHFVDLDHKDEIMLADTALLASALASRVEKVLALHKMIHHLHDDVDICGQCTDDWPCETVRILNGESND